MGWMTCVAFCIVLALLDGTFASKRPLNNFIRHHERLSYDTEDVHRRVRRAEELSVYASTHIKFKALNRNFTVHFTKQHQIFAKDFKIVDGHGKRVHYDYTRFVQGNVEGHQRSHAMGLIENGRFQGSIHLHDEQYHVEPAEKYFKDDSTAKHHSVIYSHKDVEHNAHYGTAEVPDRPTTLKGSSLYQRMAKEKKELQKEEEESHKKGKERYRRGTKNRHRNTCNLKLVADHLFMKKFVRRETAIDQMVLHYQAVEFIFRNQTFNTTNEYDSTFAPEGIGFRIKEVHVWLEDSVPKPLVPTHISVYRLLELFSQMNHSSACLAYLFTDRSFDGGVMGLAYVAYRYGQPGGICDPYAKYGDVWKTYNTGVVSFQLYNREAPPVVTEISFAHELGHSFGAQNDPPNSKECVPGEKEGGNYIMYDKATPGNQKNNRAFSSCSKAAMIPVINAKGLETQSGCFEKRFWAICGNGAHEEGEICDCGTVSTCVEQCCTPVGSKIGTPCTLQNEAYECSPSRGPCCLNDTCTLAREHLKCFDGTECQESLQCDGLHFTCPERKFKPNNTLCDKDRSVCIDGYCQGSLCLKYGYEGCPCPGADDKCKVCCRKDGECVPSHQIMGMPNTTMSRGSPCDYYKGYCDALGACEPIDSDGPMRMLYYTFFTEEGIKIWFSRYWYVVLLGSILILCMMTAFVYYCQAFTPTNNPRLDQAKPHKPLRKRRKQVGGYQPGRMPMAQTYT